MSELPSTIRAFTALSVSQDIVDNVTARLMPLRAALADLNIRWVPVDNYHITLCFIGDIPSVEADNILPVVAKVSEEFDPFAVKVGHLRLFPSPETGAVLVADVARDEPLMTLQAKLNHALLDAGYDIPQRDKYRPHMTLARLRKNRVSPELLERAGDYMINPVPEVHLYRSWKITDKNGGKKKVVKNEIIRSHELSFKLTDA